jgi:hypothetical protein
MDVVKRQAAFDGRNLMGEHVFILGVCGFGAGVEFTM